MNPVEPACVSVIYLPGGRELPIFNGFTRPARKRYPYTCEAFAKLVKRDGGNDLLWRLVYLVLDGGDHARAWRRAEEAGLLDPDEAQRRRDVAFIEGARARAADARKLAAFIERNPEFAAHALAHALLTIKAEDGAVPLRTATSGPLRVGEDEVDGVNPFAFGPKTAPDVFARILRAFAASLEKAPRAKAGPWLHRWKVQPLIYPNPVDARTARADPLVSGLLFGTVLLARQFAADAPFFIQLGTQMPEGIGRPLWPVAAALVRDALGERLDAKNAQDRLTILIDRNKGLGWGGWSSPPDEFFEPLHLMP